jgi:ceramide glucosyltransferase
LNFNWHEIAFGLGLLLGAFALFYSVTAWIALRRLGRGGAPRSATALPPVTVLKPLCGTEHELYESLRSFCDQQYPDFQVVFGVSDASDPAIAVVRRLQLEFPGRHLDLVVDRRQHGSNRKVSNLINMMAFVRHDHLVIADSDVRVTPDYLSRVVPPLQDPGVGIVTCAYRGRPVSGFWSLLGSLFINEWFMPSVGVAALSGSREFAFGVTIGIRRQVLAGVGGFTAIADQLADDYRLGELTRDRGLRTVLSDVVVETSVHEPRFADLVSHELRWLRTIRAVRPLGYLLSFVTFSVPAAALGAALTGGAPLSLTMLAITAAARLLLHTRARRPGASAAQLWVLPFRDSLNVVLWGWSFTTRRVHWRDDYYRVSRDGSAELLGRI